MMLSLLRGPVGALIARPWFDALALMALRRWVFPLSRLWAAGNAAEGDREAFEAALGGASVTRGRKRLGAILAELHEAQKRRDAAEARWTALFFGEAAAAPGMLAGAEGERIAAAHAHNLARRLFLRLGIDRPVEPVRWAIPSPAEVEAALGPLPVDPRVALSPEGLPAVVRSQAIEDGAMREYWLRFPSPWPRLGDEVTAWVYEPRDVQDPPTLIFGHGLCTDVDHWKGLKYDAQMFTRAGIRVVRPEAAFHGWRVARDAYSGEGFIAAMPLGAIDTIASSILEWAALIAWARATSAGPVAVGGISLGALIAQGLLARARDWPEALRPDAALLVTHCDSVWDAHEQGRLAEVWGGRARIAAAGWERRTIAPFLPLIDPTGPPAVAPEAIVTLNGRHDTVTPFASAEALLERWRVPAANRTDWPRGHFSVVVGLFRDQRPIERFNGLLTGLRGR